RRRPPAAGRHGQRSVGQRGEFRERVARAPPLHTPAGLGGAADPRGSDLGQSRQDRRVAAPRGYTADRGPAAGPFCGLREAGRETGNGQKILAQGVTSHLFWCIAPPEPEEQSTGPVDKNGEFAPACSAQRKSIAERS